LLLMCSVLLAAVPAGAVDQATSPQAAVTRKPGDYPLGPDSQPKAGGPKGRLEGPFQFHSTVLAGTVRRYWLFVPAQCTGDTPANVLVFQDGQRATNPRGIAARAAGARKSDRRRRDPGHDRHLHHARRSRRDV